jgi:hypothetical protein
MIEALNDAAGPANLYEVDLRFRAEAEVRAIA